MFHSILTTRQPVKIRTLGAGTGGIPELPVTITNHPFFVSFFFGKLIYARGFSHVCKHMMAWLSLGRLRSVALNHITHLGP